MLTKPVTVVETQGFVKQAEKIWDEAERVALIDHMAINPEAGVMIPGTGGIRKLRWGREGSGKRGGARVIYFYYHDEAPLFLITAYAKSRTSNISEGDKRAFAALVASIKARHGTARTMQ